LLGITMVPGGGAGQTRNEARRVPNVWQVSGGALEASRPASGGALHVSELPRQSPPTHICPLGHSAPSGVHAIEHAVSAAGR
jgi:hypothetical protein